MGDTIGRENLVFELKEVQRYLRSIDEYRKANMVDFALGYVERFNPSITDLVKAVHQNAINKSWYEEPRSFGEVIALMHSELSEALEDRRNGRGFREIWFEGDKPCGIPTELADTVIRIFDTCGHLGIDLEAAILQKMAYNSTRSARHGGKKL